MTFDTFRSVVRRIVSAVSPTYRPRNNGARQEQPYPFLVDCNEHGHAYRTLAGDDPDETLHRECRWCGDEAHIVYWVWPEDLDHWENWKD